MPHNPQPSTHNSQRILRARIILPVARPLIENGAVCISDNRITAVGRWSDFSPPARVQVVDLGEMILLPGLVNAHCHLDYTDMAGQFRPSKSFTDWIKLITTSKAGWSYADFAQSWLHGAQMLIRTGTTTVADIEAVPELLPDVWNATPLRVFSFLEMTGIKSRRLPRAILQEAANKITSLAAERGRVGLSPHAPYSTVPELMWHCADVARKRNWRLTTHVAESATEFEMFMHARGEMFDWLRRNQRDMSDCGGVSPVQHLERNGLLAENLLAVHANYLDQEDATLLAERQVSVVHCPRSHDFFEHQTFPRPELAAARVNLCLGTDSLATVRKRRGQSLELNLFEEMRAFSARALDQSPESVLRIATLNGARALGMTGQIGELSENAFADLIAIPHAGKTATSYDTVLQHTGGAAASMIDGQWALAPGQ
ncbi:MAG: amidohydrolase family protein [Verrucomicrobia bacterium]|nr:amidohydrolase family protein [Verrucomicrobiota bacterium]